MSWTTPGTVSSGGTATAAFWNAQVRDNMLETAAAAAAAAGDLVYADAANSMGSRLAHPGTGRFLVSAASNALAWREIASDVNFTDGATSATSGTTTYGFAAWGGTSGRDLPSVTVTTGTVALVILTCNNVSNDTTGEGGAFSFGVRPAAGGFDYVTTGAAREVQWLASSAGDSHPLTLIHLETGLTAQSNVFHMYAKELGGTGSLTIVRPKIIVIPF